MRKFFGSLIVASLLGIIACAAPDDADYETLHEKCKNEPQLPECQEPDEGQEDSGYGEDY